MKAKDKDVILFGQGVSRVWFDDGKIKSKSIDHKDMFLQEPNNDYLKKEMLEKVINNLPKTAANLPNPIIYDSRK